MSEAAETIIKHHTNGERTMSAQEQDDKRSIVDEIEDMLGKEVVDVIYKSIDNGQLDPTSPESLDQVTDSSIDILQRLVTAINHLSLANELFYRISCHRDDPDHKQSVEYSKALSDLCQIAGKLYVDFQAYLMLHVYESNEVNRRWYNEMIHVMENKEDGDQFSTENKLIEIALDFRKAVVKEKVITTHIWDPGKAEEN